jgi:hypothetical protein
LHWVVWHHVHTHHMGVWVAHHVLRIHKRVYLK